MSISFEAPAILGSHFISPSEIHLHEPQQKQDELGVSNELSVTSKELNTLTVDLHYETFEEEDEFGAWRSMAFRAWFCIGGRKYIFTGRFCQRVPCFNGCARFYYRNLNQLRGSQAFTGRLGPSAIYLHLCNGVVIAGKLHRRLYRSYRLTGRGVWSCAK